MAEKEAKTTKCPFVNKPTEEKPLCEIPYYSGFRLFNFKRLFNHGFPYLQEVSKELDSEVFRMSLNGTHNIVTGHIAAKACYEDEMFIKEPSLGIFKINTKSTRDFMPMVNGESHHLYKEKLMTYLQFVNDNLDQNQVFNDIANQFENNKMWEASSNTENGFEGMISEMFSQIVTKCFLGESINRMDMEEWIPRSAKFCYGGRLFKSRNDKNIAEKLYRTIEASPNFQKLQSIIGETQEEGENIKNFIIYSIVFAGYAGPRLLLLSIVVCLHKLISVENKNRLEEECEAFMKREKKSFQDVENLPYLHKFYMEVARLFPSAPNLWRRPKQDIVIESASNRYKIPKNDMVAVKLQLVHRDPLLYENPNDFSMDRDLETVSNNTYTWGGLYNVKPTPDNFKYPGAHFATILLKIFTIHLMKCDMVAANDIPYTGRNVLRSTASDEPIEMLKFQYRGY